MRHCLPGISLQVNIVSSFLWLKIFVKSWSKVKSYHPARGCSEDQNFHLNLIPSHNHSWFGHSPSSPLLQTSRSNKILLILDKIRMLYCCAFYPGSWNTIQYGDQVTLPMPKLQSRNNTPLFQSPIFSRSQTWLKHAMAPIHLEPMTFPPMITSMAGSIPAPHP